MFGSRSRVARLVRAVVILAALAATLAAGAAWSRARARRLGLEEARRAMTEGRWGRARVLLGPWSDDGEALLLLGQCELGVGHRDAALAAWERVPASSPSYPRAAALRAGQLINMLRWSAAEQVLDEARSRARPGSGEWYDLMRVSSRLYRFEGRVDDVRRVLRASWYRSSAPAEVLKELWALDHSPMPVEAVQVALDKGSPDDDRVWLGQANFAVMTGRFDDAAEWIDRALDRRPDDLSVWRAKLNLARGTGDLAGVLAAAGHLPADGFEPVAIRTLRAWVAGRLGHATDERRELEALIRERPGDPRALERLAVLTIEVGEPRRSEELRRRKAEVDQFQDRMRRELVLADDPRSNARDLSDLCRRLGRDFDARAWSIVAEAGPEPVAVTATEPTVPASDIESPPGLPRPLRDRAAALCADYGTEPSPTTGPMLADRLADLGGAEIVRSDRSSTGSERPSGSEEPAIHFVDEAEAAGLRFTFENGQTMRHLLPETMSGGVGLLDFDGDGWLDIYGVQGGSLFDRSRTIPGDRLFRNRGDGTFEDATERSRIAAIAWGRGYGMGVAVGDYDNDGDPDLFVTRLDSYALYRNRGDGTFEDVTEAVGLAGHRDNPTSAAFADLDGDGDLDLYVCHYMTWDPDDPRTCKNDHGEFFYCDPSRVDAAPDRAFRNDGGRFVDVTADSGLVESGGRGLGVVAADLDDDGLLELYVANDGTANLLFHNLGGFHFEEIGELSGVAGDASGGYQAGMGVACGDLDGDGRPDLLVTNFYGEGATYYLNLGHGLFADHSSASGFGLATRYLLGFGIAMVDVANAGRPDVLIVNGHVNDNRPYFPYAMPARLYANRLDGRLVDISDRAGDCWEVPRVGRGLAAGDLDNDGRVDAVILAQNGPLAYFHNRSDRVGHFLTLQLEGNGSNRDGVGARVIVEAGGRRQVAYRIGGGSYQSANDPRLHYGLGDHDRVDVVEVRWMSGRVDRHESLDADAGYLLREGQPKPRPLAGFASRPGRTPVPGR